MTVEGPLAFWLMAGEAGGHLYSKQHGGFELSCLTVSGFSGISGPDISGSDSLIAENRMNNPKQFPEIIRIYDHDTTILDVRTRLLMPARTIDRESFRKLLLSRLPIPEEINLRQIK